MHSVARCFPLEPSTPVPTDTVTQLNHLCRDLKASLVRGHEDFAAAVGHLTQLTQIPVRLPQLAQARELMDCIKKVGCLLLLLLANSRFAFFHCSFT